MGALSILEGRYKLFFLTLELQRRDYAEEQETMDSNLMALARYGGQSIPEMEQYTPTKIRRLLKALNGWIKREGPGANSLTGTQGHPRP